MRLAFNGEGAATGLTAIPLRFGVIEAALDDVFGVPAGGASGIAHVPSIELLSQLRHSPLQAAIDRCLQEA